MWTYSRFFQYATLEKLGFEAAVLGNGRATTGDGGRRIYQIPIKETVI
jgi:hypothetical protein